MVVSVRSAAVLGVDGFGIDVEVHAHKGNSAIVVVGLPDTAIRESRDRVTTAISNSLLRWPVGRITVNLAPADVRKEGPAFDLPIAVGMTLLAARNSPQDLHDYCIAGELALDGTVRPVKGALPIALEARQRGLRALILPRENAREASLVQGLDIFPVSSLRETVDFLRGNHPIPIFRSNPNELLAEAASAVVPDLSDIRGQHLARRAMEVAVSGGHNLLLMGSPGCGKSMLAKRIPGLIPPMSLDEAIETTRIHSTCGLLLGKSASVISTRPFRSPHHTISDAGLLGGSAIPSPGEVSLAHNGVLFLDELPEFKRPTLEVLRQPLEDGTVTITRAAGTMTFPADFMLVAALNPCPCGYFGDPNRTCSCSTAQIQRYRQRISGPLLDRIDIQIEVPAVTFREMAGGTDGEASAAVRHRIATCRETQQTRFRGSCRNNARMTSRLIRQHCQLDDASSALLQEAMQSLKLSARAYDRILRVARTIADLDGATQIAGDHLHEAISYRTLDRNHTTE
jgi:magnesium chelatase family protein